MSETMQDMTDDELFSPTETETPEPNEAEVETPEAEPVGTQEVETVEGPKAETAEGEQKEEKPVGQASKRINQVISERNQERERVAQLEAQLAQYRQPQTQQANANPSLNQPNNLQEPNVEDFDFETEEGVDAYFEATEQHERLAEKHKEDQIYETVKQRLKAEKTQEQVISDFEKKATESPQFTEDFKNLQAWITDKPLAANLSSLYQGADMVNIVAEIASDENLYYELADMSEAQQYAKYGQIHAQIQSRQSTPVINNKHSKAPAPANHGSGNTPMKQNEYDLSDDDYMAKYGLQ